MVNELHCEKVVTDPSDMIEIGHKWNGYQTYNCTYPGCGMNDTNYERLKKHIENLHQTFFGTRYVQTSLVDSSGQPILMEVTQHGD